jgi:DNA-binding transcriptional LysR family regulator
VRHDLNDIHVFATVVRLEGFSAAGKELGLPGSAVSRRVARLEEQLGFSLLHRTTRSVGLTDAGRRFYEHAGRIPGLVDAAVRAAESSRAAPSGLLRITAPPDDGGIIWGLLAGFMMAHPDVDLELTHTLDRVDLVAAEIDVALRGGPAPDSSSFTAQKLFDSRILLAASPAYLSARGTPQQVDELEHHDGICMDPWAPNAIRRVKGDGAYVRVYLRNRVRANSLETARRAAVDGLGIAPLLELTCRAELDRGDLVEVLRGALPDNAPFWALTPLGRTRSAAASALLSWLVEHLRS